MRTSVIRRMPCHSLAYVLEKGGVREAVTAQYSSGCSYKVDAGVFAAAAELGVHRGRLGGRETFRFGMGRRAVSCRFHCVGGIDGEILQLPHGCGLRWRLIFDVHFERG